MSTVGIKLFAGAVALAGIAAVVAVKSSHNSTSASANAVPLRGEPINSAPNGQPPSTTANTAPTTASAVNSTQTNTVTPGSTTNSPALADAQPVVDSDGFLAIGFDRLAGFPYVMPDDLADTNKPASQPDQIPARVHAFNDKRVSLKGFMLPLKVQNGLVTELLVMRDQSMCCYGAVPKINEWVSVKMVDKGVKPIMDQPVMLYGKLHVGEMRENGYLVGIYQLDGEKMAGAGN
ncbi:MAG TPA: DUF3299 domain-containing protein [Verrucomicrobiae bacterium]|nr:DUF3299 domain-containing protein [Verrucomicrobiae bacterium]